MAYTDDVFNTWGKIPTDANFWKQSIDRFVSSDGITSKFSRVIAEQMYLPSQSPKTPWYNQFAGRPIDAGAGVTERVLEQKAGYHFNPKASASDALQFYDSTGIEKTFEIDVSGRRSVSLPSDLQSLEEFIEANGPATLSNRLYELNNMGYQLDANSFIGKKAVSCSKAKVTLDDPTDLSTMYETIRDTATDMMCAGVDTYNELTTAENANIDISAERVLAFMPVKLWNQLRSSRASLPSPGELVDNVTVVPVYDTALPTPITTAEWGVQPSTGITWADKPVNIDGKTPLIYLVDPRKIEYRPVKRSYKINMNRNGAGDFDNAHLVYRGMVQVRPWYNACSIIDGTA